MPSKYIDPYAEICYRKLTITSQQTHISASNIDPDSLVLPLYCHDRMR